MKGIKRMLALFLAGATAFSLCACGNTKKEELPKEVYTASFAELQMPEAEGSENYFYNIVPNERGFYGFRNVKTGERELEPGEELTYEGQLDVYGEQLIFVDLEGKVTTLEGYRPMETEVKEGYGSYSNVGRCCRTADGGFLMLVEVNEWKSQDDVIFYEEEETAEPADDEAASDAGTDAGTDAETDAGTDAETETEEVPDDVWYNDDYRNYYYLRELDETGAERSCIRLDTDGWFDEDYVYLSDVAALGDDQVLVLSGERLLILERKTGKLLYEIGGGDGWWTQTLLPMRDGRVALLYSSNDNQGYHNYVATVNAKNGTLENEAVMDNYVVNYVPCFSDDYDACYTNGTVLYGLDVASGTSKSILNWVNCDVDPNQIVSSVVCENGEVRSLNYESDQSAAGGGKQYLTTLRLVDRSTLPERETVTMATAYDTDFAASIIRFNRSQDAVRIELRNYAEYNTEDDWSAGVTKLKTEILAGNCPDILVLNGLNYRQIAARGLLADLYPLIDADAELNREDLLSAAARALEVDGKLCSLSASFTVNFAVGLKTKVGDRSSWTYSEALQTLEKMSEDCTVWSVDNTAPDLLNYCLQIDGDSFVDWKTGEVRFDGEEFISLLKLAKKMPSSFDYENYDWSDDDTATRLMNGDQLLCTQYFSSFSDIVYLERNFGGLDKIAMIGMPSVGGRGATLEFNNALAICEGSRHKEAAWQFVRGLLTNQSRDNGAGYKGGYVGYDWGFPTNAQAFKALEDTARTPQYEKDGDGRPIIDPETGEKRMQAIAWYYDEEQDDVIPIYSLDDKELGAVEKIIENASSGSTGDQEVIDIVLGQVEAYFSGQRSAEETAKIIQSKVSLYVNENR